MSHLPRRTGPFFVCSRSTDLVSHFAGTEAYIMIRGLLENIELLKISEEEAFDKAVESLEHKRSKEQIREWWQNLTKYYREEKQWPTAVEKYVREEDKNRLHEIILKSMDDRKLGTEASTDLGVKVTEKEIIEEAKAEENCESLELSANTPDLPDEETLISSSESYRNDPVEKTIHETILRLYIELSTEGQGRIRREIEQLS